MAGRVKKKIALVTGGAMGLGKADCELLAAEGAQVIVTDREVEMAHKVAEEVQGDAFESQDWPTQLKIAGIEIFSAGDPAAQGEELVLRDRAAGVYRRLLLRGDHLVSAVLVGDKRGGAWYSQLIRQRADISGFRSTLMFGRQLNHAGQQAAQAA